MQSCGEEDSIIGVTKEWRHGVLSEMKEHWGWCYSKGVGIVIPRSLTTRMYWTELCVKCK